MNMHEESKYIYIYICWRPLIATPRTTTMVPEQPTMMPEPHLANPDFRQGKSSPVPCQSHIWPPHLGCSGPLSGTCFLYRLYCCHTFGFSAQSTCSMHSSSGIRSQKYAFMSQPNSAAQLRAALGVGNSPYVSQWECNRLESAVPHSAQTWPFFVHMHTCIIFIRWPCFHVSTIYVHRSTKMDI